MEVRIHAVHFDVPDKLEAFVEKKVSKLAKFHEDVVLAEVTLKLIKPESAQNKEVSISLKVKNGDCFAEKTRDTFEKAIDECVEAIEKQLIKSKEKSRI
ncbi:MAG: ribosome-associated translation inhibitor RaiA [Tannerellaceae bacterium]|jgi:putative sigma-54 modulation protein|nr:ribosome-associated translation inhibitor RaiA [Tannerellaceae bacterium]